MPWLRKLKVTQFVLEFTIPVAGDFAVLNQLPESSTIGLGSVDVRGAKIDSVEEIADRVERALRHIEPSRITLNPDCGFAPGSAADIPLDEAYQKLKNEVAAAEILRKRHAQG